MFKTRTWVIGLQASRRILLKLQTDMLSIVLSSLLFLGLIWHMVSHGHFNPKLHLYLDLS